MFVFLRILILLSAGVAVATSATAEPLRRSVLFLEQDDPGRPWYLALSSGFRMALSAGSTERINVYAGNLDLNRFSTPEYRDGLLLWLQVKYRDRNICQRNELLE